MLIQHIQYLSDFTFNLYELLPAFIYTNNIGRLVNSLFGVEIFNPFPSFTSLSPSSGNMSNKH